MTTRIMAVMLAAAATATPPIDPARVIDLTYTLDAQTPYWPGDAYKPFSSEPIATFEKDGVDSRAYCTPEHLGTHVDAPNHFAPRQAAVDRIPPADLLAPAIVIDIAAKAATDPDAVRTLGDVRAWEKVHGEIPEGVIVLLRTGWADRVGDLTAYRNADAEGRLHFPSYSVESARYLVVERRARALGIDNLSIDPGVSTDFAVHHLVNGEGRYGLENVANLDRLPATGTFLIVAPLKIGGGTGGQARIFAILP